MTKPIKLLVVDDEPQNTQIMREILSFHPHYEYQIAMSGEEALRILEIYFPDIILLDIMMPGIDGYEVCRRIREGNKHRFSKILMISGRSMIGDRLKGYSAGADDYITKPFIEDELFAKLEVFSKLNRMEEVDLLKTTALNILSHETRTPLNGIILGSELLNDIQGLPGQAKRYIEMIRQSGMRIQAMVEKISRYCAIKDGLQLNLSKGRLDVFIESILERYEQKVRVKFYVERSEELVLLADWDLLSEAIIAILDNAVKNTPTEGVVTIDCLKNGQFLSIHFKDEGPSVDPVMMGRVFDGLYSVDILHHRQGTGLGLAIAKEIIEEHGGKITCRNRSAKGRVFQVSFQENCTA